VEYKVNFLEPVPVGTVTAYGNILRLGRTIAVGATEIRNEAAKVVAFGSATYYILNVRSSVETPAIMERKTTRERKPK
jgi:acyl-coenzyme A thioesterase PaaI-like protein